MNGESSKNTIPGLVQNKVFKIIVLGDSAVGKTCLTYRFCEGKFLEKAEATIGVDFRERSVKIFNEDVKLQLWDTAGQERFRKSMVQHYYRNVHAIVIVYDVTKPDTFQSVNSWMEEVLYHSLEGAPRVLVGNKCDSEEYKSRVPTLLAQRIADKYEMPLFETSARLDSECDNVESIFMTLAHKLYSKQPFKAIRLQSIPDPTKQVDPPITTEPLNTLNQENESSDDVEKQTGNHLHPPVDYNRNEKNEEPAIQ